MVNKFASRVAGEPAATADRAAICFSSAMFARIRCFAASERDVHADVHVNIAQAVLGAKVDVKTLDGEVTLTLPAGTSSGSKMRLRGRGVPASSAQPAGDLIANIQIDVPAAPTEEQKELMRQFAATLSKQKVEQKS
ncbi:MAG: DnaJ C-terminal domain-containing protein [Phycisphaerae bacterium]